jgi:hypothetical protein
VLDLDAGELMNDQVIAEFLKYLGLIVGTASAIWGAANELKEDDPKGGKRLSVAGKTSIAITVISLVVSLTSAAVGDKLARAADKSAEAKRQAETVSQIQRHQELISRQLEALALSEKAREEQHQRFDGLTRQEARSASKILMAGQSLRDISLTWTFPRGGSIANALFSQFDGDVDELDKEWGRDPHWNLYYEKKEYLNYDDVVRSLLNQLGVAASNGGSTLAMFKLDDTGAVVLPPGFLKVNQLGTLDVPLKDVDVAAGIELSGEGSPTQRRKFTSSMSLPEVYRTGSAVELRWDLSGVNSVRAIDKADPSLIAVLPHQMQVVVLTSIENLPVNPSETSEATYLIDMWHVSTDGKKDLTPMPLRASRLRLVPNGVESMASTYEMKLVKIQPVLIREPDKWYCQAAIWSGRLLEAEP